MRGIHICMHAMRDSRDDHPSHRSASTPTYIYVCSIHKQLLMFWVSFGTGRQVHKVCYLKSQLEVELSTLPLLGVTSVCDWLQRKPRPSGPPPTSTPQAMGISFQLAYVGSLVVSMESYCQGYFMYVHTRMQSINSMTNWVHRKGRMHMSFGSVYNYRYLNRYLWALRVVADT